MENEDRIKALNILFSSCCISLFVSTIIAGILHSILGRDMSMLFAAISPILAYCIGRYLCFKEYKDETT